MKQFFLILFLFAVTAISVGYIGFTLPELFPSSQPAQVVSVVNLPERDNLVNQVTAFNNQLFANSSADLSSVSQERKEAMFKLAQTSPRDFLRLAIDGQTRAQLPAAVRDNIEVETKLRGPLQLMHGDSAEPGGQVVFSYSLTNAQGVFHLATTGALPANFEGAEIEVRGMLLGHTIVVHSGGRGNINFIQTAPTTATTLTTAVGSRRLLVVPVSFTNSPPHPFDRATAHSLVFSGPTQSFIQEESYGQTSLAGDTLDWLDIPHAHTSELMWSQINTRTPEVAAYLTANQINLANYTDVVFLINFDFESGGYGGGIWSLYTLAEAQINLTNFNSQHPVPFPWKNFDGHLSHELGHNFGQRGHADGLDCGTEVSAGSCTHVEYGNSFDVMAFGAGALQMNASFKERIGWLGANDVLTITQSGRYTIKPLETNSGVRAAKILASNGHSLYLEYRRAIGFDSRISDPFPFSSPSYSSNQNGLMINWVIPTEDNLSGSRNYYPASRLLDLSPGTAGWYTDAQAASLNGSQTWTDPETGARIGPIVSNSADAITFDVVIGGQCQ